MPLVSIVLPTRNRADLLRESVESVRSQSHKNWELIIVDDASTDETTQVIDELVESDERIKYVRNPVNEKVAGSLNNGFALAKGDFLTWTSDDNLYRPGALDVMVKMISDADLVYADMTLIDAVGLTIGHQKARPPAQLMLRNVIGSCFLYNRKILDRVGAYDKQWALVEDWDYWIRAAKFKMRMKPIPDDLYECRMHDSSELSTRRQDLLDYIEKLMHKHLGSLPEPHHAAGLLHLAEIEWRHGHKKEAKRYARKAFGGPAIKLYRQELYDGLFGPGSSQKWLKTPGIT